MAASWSTIDCDVHANVPGMQALLPYLDDQWRDSVIDRGLNSLEFDQLSAECAADGARRLARQVRRAADNVDTLRAQALDRWNIDIAICNCLYGVQLLFSEDMAAAFAKAINDWVAKEWLDRDPRLRASIVVPMQNTDYAVAEIERCAPDSRFVQVLVLAMGEAPLGRREYWPVFEAAQRHGLPIGIHAGSSYPASGHLARLAVVVRRGLLRAGARLSGASREPGVRRCLRQISRAESGAD